MAFTRTGRGRECRWIGKLDRTAAVVNDKERLDILSRLKVRLRFDVPTRGRETGDRTGWVVPGFSSSE
jgi:hypothetical protein